MELSGTLVFSSGKQGDYDIFSLDLAKRSVWQLTEGGECWNDFPRWSPDGSKILFLSNRLGTQDIWIMNQDGSDQAPVTQPGKWHGSPDWAPDGRSIIFCANYDGNINIYTMNLDGTGLQQITNYAEADYTPSFSPDGKRIVFVSKRAGSPDIWTCDRQGGGLGQLTHFEGRDYSPAFSPDGKKILFVSGLIGNDGQENLEIYVMDADGKNKERLTCDIGQDRFAQWSPDGSKIVFSTDRKDGHSSRLMVMELATKRAESIFFDREKLDAEIGSKPIGVFCFKYLPEWLLRRFYPAGYFGSERYPDWKA